MKEMKPSISKKKVLHLGFWLVVFAFLFILLPMVFSKDKEQVCKEIYIEIEPKDELFFIEKDDVITMLKEANDGRSIIGQAKEDFDLNSMEDALRNNPFLGEAE